MAGNEEDVIRFYERFWSKSELWWETDTTLAIHLGFYDKGIRSHTAAVFRMNEVSWDLLGLKVETPAHILDAGCGVGGTSIYLAQKYPHVVFTGITIVPAHVTMAERFAQKRHATANTRFLTQNYCHTSFPDQSFDGIIALESVNYAHSNKELMTELCRILKPGGRLVILDGFRTTKPIPGILKKIYQIWLDGRGLLDLEATTDITTCLKQQGFQEVIVTDISSHVFQSYFFGVLIGSLFFIPALIKKIIGMKNQCDTTDYQDFDCYMAVTLAGGFLALYGCFKYYAITATK